MAGNRPQFVEDSSLVRDEDFEFSQRVAKHCNDKVIE